MKLHEIARELELAPRTGQESLDVEVGGGYASDLLSDVLANAREGDLWVTLQVHQNVVAVAGMKCLAGVVLVNGREPQEETLVKAKEEGLAILISPLPAFELIGRMHELGLSGARK